MVKPFLNRRPLLLFLAVALLIGLLGLCPGWAQDRNSTAGVPSSGGSTPREPAASKSALGSKDGASSELIRWHRDTPGDSAPIILDADQIITWGVGDSQYVLLRGQVLVQQSVVQVRCEQAVGWLDRKVYKDRKVWQMVLYAENQVAFDAAKSVKSGSRGLFELCTRGELKLQTHKEHLVQKNLASDPLVIRALEAAQSAPRVAADRETSHIQQAGGVLPETPNAVRHITPVAPPLNGGGSRPTTPVMPVAPVTPALLSPITPPPATLGKPTPTVPVTPPAGLPVPMNPVPIAPVTPGTPPGLTPVTPPALAPVTPVTPVTPGQQPQTMISPPNASSPLASAGGDRVVVYRAAMPEMEGADGSGGTSTSAGVTFIPTNPASPTPSIQQVQMATPSAPVPPGSSGTPGTPSPLQVVPPGGGPPGAPLVPPLPPPSKFTRTPGTPPAVTPQRNYTITPRQGLNYQITTQKLPTGETAVIVTGGVILSVRGDPKQGLIDIEADRLVIFTRSLDPGAMIGKMEKPQVGFEVGGANPASGKEMEFYLAGNVEIRNSDKQGSETLRAAEVYYDVTRNVAIALTAVLEIQPKMAGPNVLNFSDPLYVKADEILRTSATTFDIIKAEIYSSKLPSDPGLRVYIASANIEDRSKQKKNIFGQPVYDPKTGQPVMVKETILTAQNMLFELENVPYFWLPYMQDDIRDPLGPIQNFSGGYNRIFGFMIGTSLDVYKLLGLEKVPGTRWRLDLAEMTVRGPMVGTRFDYSEKDLFGLPNNSAGMVRAFAIYDQGYDILGGNRLTNQKNEPPAFIPDGVRGRAFWRQNILDLPEGFTVQSQGYYISDRNVLEQYYKTDFDSDLSPQTFLYAKQQKENWAWTVDTEAHIRSWINETIWLPKADGYLIGQSIFDVLTWSSHASAGYGQLRTSTDPEPQVSPTDIATNSGRFNLMQELALPLQMGAFKVVPYGRLQTTEYTSDIAGNTVGRLWGAVGTRATLSVSQLYADAYSELLNVNGINHKMTFGINAWLSRDNLSYSQLPQMDRLNDDATDMALRDLRPNFPNLYPSVASVLTGPIYDPQTYAIRQLLMTSTESVDALDVIQGEWRQRWQTKRGYTGFEHIIDWMTLDLSASFFPRRNQDNYGSYWAFLTYNWIWNIGDRTALFSNGWVDPYTNGPDYFLIGANFNRGDRTQFSLSFREIDPIQSRSVTGSVTYIFGPKYAMTASVSYDFGSVPVISEALVLTRMGRDVQVSMGLNYNNLQNTVGFQFEIVPNLAVNSMRNSISGLSPGLNSASPNFNNQY